MVIARQDITIEEFEAFIALPENAERRFELINGEIIEKVPTQLHGIITVNIATEINLYFRQNEQNKTGHVAVEVRHRLADDDENDRLPDVSVVLGADKAIVEQGPVVGMPDLAVEVQSPDDSLREMREKADFYLANGARMVWLFYLKRIVEVLTKDDRQLLNEDDILEGGDVLPGFAVRVEDFYPKQKGKSNKGEKDN